MSEKTTPISDQPHRPLEVEYNTNQHCYAIVGGESVRTPQTGVTLTVPQSLWRDHRVRLLDLSPRTALNLLAWLEHERATLEQLASAEEAETRRHRAIEQIVQLCEQQKQETGMYPLTLWVGEALWQPLKTPDRVYAPGDFILVTFKPAGQADIPFEQQHFRRVQVKLEESEVKP